MQDKLIERLVRAYAANNIPMTDDTLAKLRRLPRHRVEALAEHWEDRAEEANDYYPRKPSYSLSDPTVTSQIQYHGSMLD